MSVVESTGNQYRSNQQPNRPKSKGGAKRFFSNILSSLVGSLFAVILGGVVLMLIFFGIIGSLLSSEDEIKVAESSVLKINLNTIIVEEGSPSLIPQLADLDLPIQELNDYVGLNEISKAIRKAKDDERIKAIFLEVGGNSPGYAQIEELRRLLTDFKESGKKVVAYGAYVSEKSFYLASVSDQFIIAPEGLVEFNGLVSERMFFKGFLDKWDLQPAIFKVGKFKSAVEPFLKKKMSDESRLQTQLFLESIYSHTVKNIAKEAGKEYNEVREISDSMYVRNPYDAKERGLITEVGYKSDVEELLKEIVEIDKEAELEVITMRKYLKSFKLESKDAESKEDKIAIIVAEGEIVDEGEGITPKSFIKKISKARKDKSVKAVVLRINSPGGSALASDLMWNEIQLCAKEKPVVASMSNVCASGGYYMAMGCTKILAEPITITGSIGVFAVFPKFNRFFENNLGVTFDRVKTGKYADLFSTVKPMNPEDSAVIQQGVDEIYQTFIKKAAEGRGMEVELIDSLAGGRVYSGLDALEVGLVDELGGIQAAVVAARKLGDLDESIDGVYYPKRKESLFGEKDEKTKVTIKETVLQQELGEFYQYYKAIKKLENLRGIQARLPYELEIH